MATSAPIRRQRLGSNETLAAVMAASPVDSAELAEQSRSRRILDEAWTIIPSHLKHYFSS